jgi:hypothetical protein
MRGKLLPHLGIGACLECDAQEETVLTNNVMRSRLASLAVSALSITIAAGIVSAEEANVTTEQSRNVGERRLQTPTSDTDSRNEEAYELQMPRLLLQTDQAMEQSSRVLEQSTREKAKEQR